MNIATIKRLSPVDRRMVTGLITGVLVLVALTLVQDALRANLNNSGYYFSESLLFSSFWWLFAPLLFAQFLFAKRAYKKPLPIQLLVVFLPLLMHLFIFPFFVWILSKLFYYHAFAFEQTLRYTLSEHAYLLVVLYALPFTFTAFFIRQGEVKKAALADKQPLPTPFLDTILASEGGKKYPVAVIDILYFSANPPYITMHLADKKYLQSDTLKALTQKLDPHRFIRVHKSTIINIERVTSYTSRLNGDYDVVMDNSVTLRVSRNFAPAFKQSFRETHRVA